MYNFVKNLFTSRIYPQIEVEDGVWYQTPIRFHGVHLLSNDNVGCPRQTACNLCLSLSLP